MEGERDDDAQFGKKVVDRVGKQRVQGWTRKNF